jgi:Leucine-rich repeat (LRR) protein
MKQLLIISFSFFYVTVCIQAEQSDPRTVHFPKDQAVGRLMIRDIGSGQHYTLLLSWELLGQAQGDVTIPAGKELRLEVYRDVTDISFISKIKPNDLEALSLSRTNIVDKDFVHLKDLTGLLALDISSMKQIDGSGLAHLANLKSLKELSCFNTGIEDFALEHISKFHSIEELSLYWTQINGSGLIHIKNLTSLKNLSLSKTSITDESLAHLKDMTWMKELELYDTQIGDNGLAYLKGLTSLEKLILGSIDRESGISPITDAGLAHLNTLTELKNLGLYQTRITDKVLKHLGSLTNLESLSLNKTQITGEGFAFFNKSAPLRGLELDECALTGTGLANLKPWSNTLENLDMAGVKINDADLVHLADFKALKYINLRDTPITDEGLVHIKNIKSLESLTFSNTKITDEGLMILKDLPNLQRIDVTGTLVSKTGMESFKQASASKSIEANIRRMIVTSKEGGNRIIKRASPQPEAKPLPLIGKPIPDLNKIDADFDLPKGKIALICFWDMNQRPSRNCINQLAQRTEQLQQKNINIITVQAAKVDRNSLDEWLKENNIPFATGIIHNNEKQIRLKWGIQSLPWLILTNKEHVVIAEGFSLDELEDKIQTDK